VSRVVATRPGGIVCPLATPLTADGRLDEAVLRGLIEALVPDLDGLFVLGSSGELTWLPDDVAVAVARAAVDQVAGRIPVYVGVGDTGLSRTLSRADRLADVGADYMVVASPFYYSVTSEARLVESFETVAERVAAPVVLYNIPQNTHLALSPSTVGALARHPRIVGIKDSAGDWFAFEEFLALRSDGFSVLQGREQLAAVSFWTGADGLISGMANFAPRLLRELSAAVRAERPATDVHDLQARIGELADVFEQGYWLAGLKATLEACGWAVGEPSRPMPPCDADQRRVIDRILEAPAIRPWLTTNPAGVPVAASALDRGG
jgi:dihydrodipicolinate synthase/N-acetylneuraminate lyase